MVLRLGVLPRLIVPMENLILDITRMLQANDTAIGQHVTVVPAPVSPAVPANPAVDHDQLKGLLQPESGMMADLTIAVSEAVCAKTLEIVVATSASRRPTGPASAASWLATTAASS